MSVLDYTCYYVGHGAMHYIKVMDDKKTVVKKKILIDAGSNRDVFSKANANANIVKQDILNSKAKQCIFCLTHPHDDHYSYFIDIINAMVGQGKKNVLDMFCIGGCRQDEYQETVTEFKNSPPHTAFLSGIQSLFVALSKFPQDRIVFLPKVFSDPLWQDTEGVSLYYLFGNLFDLDSDNANDNSANYAVINESTDKALWVTGDITGASFNYITADTEYNIFSIVSELLTDKNVYMTVPHHGSYESLYSHGFGSCSYDSKTKLYSTPQKWTQLYDALGIKDHALIVSADFQDTYRHPDGLALGIYSYRGAYAKNTDSWMVYKDSIHGKISTLRHGSYGEVALYGKHEVGSWWYQNIPKEIHSTILARTAYYMLGTNDIKLEL